MLVIEDDEARVDRVPASADQNVRGVRMTARGAARLEDSDLVIPVKTPGRGQT